jgi:hypothetical protein
MRAGFAGKLEISNLQEKRVDEKRLINGAFYCQGLGSRVSGFV